MPSPQASCSVTTWRRPSRGAAGLPSWACSTARTRSRQARPVRGRLRSLALQPPRPRRLHGHARRRARTAVVPAVVRRRALRLQRPGCVLGRRPQPAARAAGLQLVRALRRAQQDGDRAARPDRLAPMLVGDNNVGQVTLRDGELTHRLLGAAGRAHACTRRRSRPAGRCSPRSTGAGPAAGASAARHRSRGSPANVLRPDVRALDCVAGHFTALAKATSREPVGDTPSGDLTEGFLSSDRRAVLLSSSDPATGGPCSGRSPRWKRSARSNRAGRRFPW
jgi:hypothetical protein